MCRRNRVLGVCLRQNRRRLTPLFAFLGFIVNVLDLAGTMRRRCEFSEEYAIVDFSQEQ